MESTGKQLTAPCPKPISDSEQERMNVVIKKKDKAKLPPLALLRRCGVRRDLLLQLAADLGLRSSQIEIRLQAQPELGRVAEIARQSQCSVYI